MSEFLHPSQAAVRDDYIDVVPSPLSPGLVLQHIFQGEPSFRLCEEVHYRVYREAGYVDANPTGVANSYSKYRHLRLFHSVINEKSEPICVAVSICN